MCIISCRFLGLSLRSNETYKSSTTKKNGTENVFKNDLYAGKTQESYCLDLSCLKDAMRPFYKIHLS